MPDLATVRGWIKRLFDPPPLLCKRALVWESRVGAPVLWTSDEAVDGPPLVLSLGFGSSVHDYAPLANLFMRSGPVFRVGHPGSDRRAGLDAGARLLWKRLVLKMPAGEAARAVRSFLHRGQCREQRLEQLRAAVEGVIERGYSCIDLAGHSYGTDTALMYALRHGRDVRIRTLYLFSPHPPGYLIEPWRYAELPVESVVVITGTRDWTRDGVGPSERLQVMEHLADGARSVVLDGVGHMDFAFGDLGPPGWTDELAAALGLGG